MSGELSDRFRFMDLTPKTINTFNVTASFHQQVAFIADQEDVRINIIVRRLMEVGLEEFEKAHPDYYTGPAWEKFKRMINGD